MQPTYREEESVRVLELLREVKGLPFNHREPHSYPYGDTPNLDRDTAALCRWCRWHRRRVPGMSLELQLWWRDHQQADVEKAREVKRASEREAAARRGLAKLTTEEREALGLDWKG